MADKRILRETHAEDWLISLSSERDIATVQNILSILMVSERYIVNNPPNLHDSILGFCYVSYLDSKLSLRELLYKSGIETDGAGSIECEVFYTLLIELEKGMHSEEDISFLKSISEMYEPFKAIAEKQKNIVETY